MAATVHVHYDKAGVDNAPGSELDRDAGGVRFRTDDNADTIDDSNPLPIPGAGNIQSFWIQLYIKVTAAGGFTQIDNVKFYTAGGNLYGDAEVNLLVGDETPTNNLTSPSQAGYAVALGTVGADGTIMTSHSDITGTTNANLATSASPKDVTISEATSIIDVINEKCDYVVLQIQISSTATAGVKSSETLTFRYDEI